ncbi:P-loop containing nucleoside triphosphate hydrolase protein [Roridomyces roridus]|uniref:P-loop containing nucleoside triphosphate hydrolase protein n=1 Tax=Roridomyces roridus TaxID=1738132 RepID=A0AAD7BP61_9AGAR|nr:P-loop containing nucleoside triphosphate hydrolase protein [Roridomyces roridus]
MGAIAETLKQDPKSSPDDAEPDSYTSLHLGVWRVLLPKDTTSGFRRWNMFPMEKWNSVVKAYPLVLRFLREIYELDPMLVIFVVLLKLCEGMESVLTLWVSGKLLQIIEIGLKEGRPDVNAISQALIARLLCVTFTATTKWAREFIYPIVESRVTLHYEDHLLRANLRLDIPTSSDSANKTQASEYDAWYAFEGLVEAAQQIFGLFSQLVFISQQRSGGALFTVLALIKPVFVLAIQKTLWMKPHIAYSENASYLRLRNLQTMAATSYRGDVISGNIAGWITAEYQHARDALGSLSSRDVWALYGTEQQPGRKIAAGWIGELPTLYWALNAMFRPDKFSMTSIAILQQYSASLNYSLQSLFWDVSKVGKCVTDIRILYEAENVRNKIADGEVVYPRSGYEDKKGMEIELRNVSFSYPGEKSKESALRDVSFRIPAGSLVVIVGANGSGKSSLIKLITRIYEPDPETGGAGQVLVDGLPIGSYRLSDLRQAQATLTQEHKLYPLSLGENIGLGYAERLRDEEMIKQAAKDGGAGALLEKLTDGMGTVLQPVPTAYGYQLDDEKHKGLKGVLSKLEKTAEVSGGEKQRLVAARTFMRFRTGKIKLLCVDEPSSALDPTGEFELFERLRETGAGKTMIFVTHRFGHLTKYADVIICMKEGRIAESGTHKDLMALNGEYAGLYNVQAQAFSEASRETR